MSTLCNVLMCYLKFFNIIFRFTDPCNLLAIFSFLIYLKNSSCESVTVHYLQMSVKSYPSLSNSVCNFLSVFIKFIIMPQSVMISLFNWSYNFSTYFSFGDCKFFPHHFLIQSKIFWSLKCFWTNYRCIMPQFGVMDIYFLLQVFLVR